MTSLAQLMRGVDRRNFEYKNGRIESWPNLWAWDYQYPNDEQSHPVTEEDGRTRVLVGHSAVRCPFPDEHDDPYVEVKGDSQFAWVRESACRKCKHRIKGDKRGKLRFPRCARAIEERETEKVKSSADLFVEARRKVDEWMK